MFLVHDKMNYRTIKTEKESDLQSACNRLLDTNNIFYHHRERGSHEKRLAHDTGLPDLTIWHNRDTFFIELKKETGVIKKEQNEFMEQAISNGFQYNIIRNFHQFKILLDELKIVEY